MANAPETVGSPQPGGKPRPWWRPQVAPGRGHLLPYYWANIAGLGLSIAMWPVLITLLIVGFVLHLPVPASAYLLVIAAGVLGMVVCRIVHIRFLFFAGRFWGLEGRIIERTQSPGRFWFEVTANAVPVLVLLGAAGYLTWLAAFGVR